MLHQARNYFYINTYKYSFFNLCSGTSPAYMGHHREVSGPWLALPVHQVLADCGHVCLLLHDSCHDSRPAPCHLLPIAGLPWGSNVPLEHPCHGGLGLGSSPQHTAGREGWTHANNTSHTLTHTHTHENTWWNRKWELSWCSHPDFYSRTQDVGLFLAQWGHCSSADGRGNRQSCLWVFWPPPFVRSVRCSSSLAQKWLPGCTSAGVTLLSRGAWRRTSPGWPWRSSSCPPSSLPSVR